MTIRIGTSGRVDANWRGVVYRRDTLQRWADREDASHRAKPRAERVTARIRARAA